MLNSIFEDKMKLLLNALIKFIVGLTLVGVLLFVPSGSFNYINGWLFIGLLFIPMLILGIILFFKAPGVAPVEIPQ